MMTALRAAAVIHRAEADRLYLTQPGHLAGPPLLIYRVSPD
jgi:hypothetical protein